MYKVVASNDQHFIREDVVGETGLVLVGTRTLGVDVGDRVSTPVGASVGDGIGMPVGEAVGDSVGTLAGASMGDTVEETVGISVGNAVGDRVGALIGTTVGDAVAKGTYGDGISDRSTLRTRTIAGRQSTSKETTIKKFKTVML